MSFKEISARPVVPQHLLPAVLQGFHLHDPSDSNHFIQRQRESSSFPVSQATNPHGALAGRVPRLVQDLCFIAYI